MFSQPKKTPKNSVGDSAQEIFEKDILPELVRAVLDHPQWPTEDRCRQALIVGEEAGELQQAVLNLIEFEEASDEAINFGGQWTEGHQVQADVMDAKIEREAIQVAAMALRFILERRRNK